jgi:hypothetical protein
MSTDFDARKLTWAALLGRWVEFARSALALPDDATGRALRSAVPDIIGLQAVTMALGEADELEPDERALGLDRARVLIERHTRNLGALFEGDSLPVRLAELIDDANAAVRRVEGM